MSSKKIETNTAKKLAFVRRYVLQERKLLKVKELSVAPFPEIPCFMYDRGGEFGNLLDRQLLRCDEIIWGSPLGLKDQEILDGVYREVCHRKKAA